MALITVVKAHQAPLNQSALMPHDCGAKEIHFALKSANFTHFSAHLGHRLHATEITVADWHRNR